MLSRIDCNIFVDFQYTRNEGANTLGWWAKKKNNIDESDCSYSWKW